MKKTSKTFGAVALSAVLAVGCAAPAFAADPTYTGDGSLDNAKTDVFVKGLTQEQLDNQINITLPISLELSVLETGGPLTAPSNTSYKIVNNGTKNVVVSSVVPAKGDGFELKNTKLTEPIDDTRTIHLTLQADGSPNAIPMFLASGKSNVPLGGSEYTIADKSQAKHELGLTVAGEAYPKKNGSPEDKFSTTTAARAITLTYTVAKA